MVVLLCWLLPRTSLVIGASVVLLVVAALVAMAFGLAHLATQDIPVREGDLLELRGGARGRVRAVRFCYTAVDTSEGATELVPNRKIYERNGVRQAVGRPYTRP